MDTYAKGMSRPDIKETLLVYGTEISQGLISRITDKILPEVNEWQNRPLDSIYPVIFFDGIVFNSRKDSKIINKCVYSVLGINMEGRKKILGTWISENESASFYTSICSDLLNKQWPSHLGWPLLVYGFFTDPYNFIFTFWSQHADVKLGVPLQFLFKREFYV